VVSVVSLLSYFLFFMDDSESTECYTLSLHDALPILAAPKRFGGMPDVPTLVEQGVQVIAAPWIGILAPTGTPQEALDTFADAVRSEEHTSELQSRENLVCRLLLEKKKKQKKRTIQKK